MAHKPKYYVMKIQSYDGRDNQLHCGDRRRTQDFLYCIVKTIGPDTAELWDCGYRSEAELREARASLDRVRSRQ